MNELLRKISRLISLPECSNRVYYLSDTGYQLRDIQRAARLLERELTKGQAAMSNRHCHHYDRFSPVMEVLANVALQKADVCFVDGFAIRELVLLASQTRQHGASTNPSTTASQQVSITKSSSLHEGLTMETPSLSSSKTDPKGQVTSSLDNQTHLPTSQTDCKLPSDMANMIRQKLKDLNAKAPNIQTELEEFRAVVDGYEKIGKASESFDDGQKTSFYGNTQQQINIDLARQINQLARDLRQKIADHERTIESHKERMKEYESILSAAGCSVNATIEENDQKFKQVE